MAENPYQTPTQNNAAQASLPSTTAWQDHFALFARHTILLLSLAALLLFIVPLYAAQYEIIEFMLSANLTYLVQLSKWVSTYWYLAAITTPFYYFLLFRVRPKTTPLRVLYAAWSLLFWLMALGIFVFAALHLPSPITSATYGLAP